VLAWIVFAATAPSMLCVVSSAFLAYKDKAQWVWFAALAVVGGFGGIGLLTTIGGWRLAGH
jgi:hypothetical protein